MKKRKTPFLDDSSARLVHKKVKPSGQGGGTVDASIVVVDDMARFEDQGLGL